MSVPYNHFEKCIFYFARSVVEKTCPMCRESLESTDDTWVLSEAPDSDQVNEEIRKTLISLAGTEGEAST